MKHSAYQLPIRYQKGLTLVELMVSLVLSLVLMAGALQLFSGSKQTYRLANSMSAIQENGRYALELLARDIRQAGFTGCVAAPDFSSLIAPASMSWEYDFEQPVFGYEYGDPLFPTELTSGSGPAWGTGGAEPDAVVVLFGDSAQNFPVAGPVPPNPSADLEVALGTDELFSGQLMLVTDCSRAALFQLTKSKSQTEITLEHRASVGSPGNCSANLHDTCGSGIDPDLLKPYSADVSRVLPMRAHGYYLANTDRTDAAGNAVPALYRQRLAPAGLQREELVDGVSDMQILYGVAPIGERSANTYLEADAVEAAGAWDRVVAIRIDLTMGSATGAEGAAGRKVFSTTVALRNRTL